MNRPGDARNPNDTRRRAHGGMLAVYAVAAVLGLFLNDFVEPPVSRSRPTPGRSAARAGTLALGRDVARAPGKAPSARGTQGRVTLTLPGAAPARLTPSSLIGFAPEARVATAFPSLRLTPRSRAPPV